MPQEIISGRLAWIPMCRGASVGVAALNSHFSCQTGLLYENPRFQLSLSS